MRGAARWGAAFLLVLWACAASPATPRRIVLVTIDTLRADHVGAYGAKGDPTPHIDAVAAGGVCFGLAISPAPITLPSHTTILTGMDPPEHGVHDNVTFRLADDVPLLSEQLRGAGFATAAFVGSAVLERRYGLARGFETYDDTMGDRQAAGESGFLERRADRVVDAALGWLAHAPERFFLWVHLYDPHAGYDPPAPWAEKFPGDAYTGEIAFADAQLGRLLDAVDARWSDGRTLVVVTSDHGESLGEHWEFTHALTIYDATQRVPLVMSGPGLPRGRVVAPLVRLADVAPTVLAMLGLKPAAGVDGRDLRPVVDGTETGERLAYLETLVPHFDFDMSPLYGMRSRSFKLIRAPQPELYDLRSDPTESRNLGGEGPEAQALDRALSERVARARPLRAGLLPADERLQLESLGYLTGEPEGMDLPFGEVEGLDPKEGVPLYSVGRRTSDLIEAGRAAEALAMLRAFPGRGPLADLMRARAAHAAGEDAAAEAYARSVVGSGELAEDGLVVLGEALEGLGRSDEAQQAFTDALKRDPSRSAPLLGLGRVAEARGERARAELLYAQALEDSTEARWRLAALLLEQGERGRADALLSRVPEEEQRHPDVARRLARAELAAGLNARAHARLVAALADHPGDAQLEALLRDPRLADPASGAASTP